MPRYHENTIARYGNQVCFDVGMVQPKMILLGGEGLRRRSQPHAFEYSRSIPFRGALALSEAQLLINPCLSLPTGLKSQARCRDWSSLVGPSGKPTVPVTCVPRIAVLMAPDNASSRSSAQTRILPTHSGERETDY